MRRRLASTRSSSSAIWLPASSCGVWVLGSSVLCGQVQVSHAPQAGQHAVVQLRDLVACQLLQSEVLGLRLSGAHRFRSRMRRRLASTPSSSAAIWLPASSWVVCRNRAAWLLCRMGEETTYYIEGLQKLFNRRSQAHTVVLICNENKSRSGT